MTAEAALTSTSVVVVGGGPAGCATALALRRHGVDGVVLLEARERDGRPRIGESLPPEVRLLLDRLGIWQAFLDDRHEPCLGSCSVWGADAPGYNDFLLNPHGHGWHLDRRRFDELLWEQAITSGVEAWRPARFLDVESLRPGFRIRITTASGPRQLDARFVVDASGPSCRLARALGAEQRRHDRLSYIAGFFDLAEGLEMSRLTLLEAVEYGWWYAALLPQRRVTVALASDPEIIRDHQLHRPDVWLDRLRSTRQLAPELSDCQPWDGQLVFRAAPSSRLDRAAGTGWLAVGDAASAYDPIASQGIYKALLDGLEAAETIARALAEDDAGFDGFGEAVRKRFEEYLQVRDHLYGLERRWPSAPFWSRRRAHRDVEITPR